MNQEQKILIVGPCSAESKEQVMTTAQAIRNVIDGAPSHMHHTQWLFRAGVWKPRTSPDTFQGAGEQALTWLHSATKSTALASATEVATPEHVEKALQAGIRHLWIGARTSANPIAVQAIADAVSGKEVTVLVKNPVNEDVNLWIGNIERLEKAGAIVMAIHRGCGHKPCWRMAFALRHQRPDIPILLDPSHMSGDSSKVADLCREAMTLDFDGLMIEVHTHPDKALSDSKQQITPAQLAEILNENVNVNENLPLLELRKEMDEVDEELWSVIEKRMDVSRRIGEYKKTQHIPVVQAARYEEILQRRILWAKEHAISQEAIRQIMDAIHTESVRVQS